jgi:hypothetical protein
MLTARIAVLLVNERRHELFGGSRGRQKCLIAGIF